MQTLKRLSFWHTLCVHRSVGPDLNGIKKLVSIVVKVCGVYRPTRKFFSHMQILTHAQNSWPLSSEGFLTVNVPHLLWHGPTLYIGHLRGPVTSTHVAERLAVELSLLFLRLGSVASGDRTPICRTRGERSTSTPPRRSVVKAIRI